MRTILDAAERETLKRRIAALHENSTASWGRMTVSQMIRHCAQWDEMALGKVGYRQSLLGRIFGKVALKDMMKDEPMKRNLPTVPSFRAKDEADTSAEKKRWLALLDGYASYPDSGFVHPFFGKLSREQAGRIAYKHIDHHLRQFNV